MRKYYIHVHIDLIHHFGVEMPTELNTLLKHSQTATDIAEDYEIMVKIYFEVKISESFVLEKVTTF